MSEPVTILRAGTTSDPYSGGASPDWDAAQSWTVPALVATRGMGDDASTWRDVSTTDLTLYLPSDVDLLGTDRVVVRGETYEVEGEPFQWGPGLGGWRPGVAAALTRLGG